MTCRLMLARLRIMSAGTVIAMKDGEPLKSERGLNYGRRVCGISWMLVVAPPPCPRAKFQASISQDWVNPGWAGGWKTELTWFLSWVWHLPRIPNNTTIIDF